MDKDTPWFIALWLLACGVPSLFFILIGKAAISILWIAILNVPHLMHYLYTYNERKDFLMDDAYERAIEAYHELLDREQGYGE